MVLRIKSTYVPLRYYGKNEKPGLLFYTIFFRQGMVLCGQIEWMLLAVPIS